MKSLRSRDVTNGDRSPASQHTGEKSEPYLASLFPQTVGEETAEVHTADLTGLGGGDPFVREKFSG